MPQQAKIYRALIASPGDCTHERILIPKIISEWNASHSSDESAIIESVKWETHTYPSLDGRPQEIINSQIAEKCDFLIGTFWTKLGTPTGVAKSGTIEEIELFRSAKKPVLLYFSSVGVKPNELNIEQYQELALYKKELQIQGLYSEYESLEDLKEKLRNHIAATMISLLRGGKGKSVDSLPVDKISGSNEDTHTSSTTEAFKEQSETQPEEQLTELPYGGSVGFFAHRIAKAFPGERGIVWFDNAENATERLMLLLKQPLIFKPDSPEFGGQKSPVWWFRAGSSMMIENVTRLSATRILMDGEELNIKRIAISQSHHLYRCFVYVEVQAEEQTGLYKYSEVDIEDQRKALGYASEEYALFNGHMIKRTEYDDGAAVINSNIVEIHGAELRTRYLTNYNFIICAQEAAFNSHKFDAGSEDFMDEILTGKHSTEGFFNWMGAFSKEDYYR